MKDNFKITQIENNFWMDVDDVVADEIRDWVNWQLQVRGLDANYELTEEGKILDELSDAFYL